MRMADRLPVLPGDEPFPARLVEPVEREVAVHHLDLLRRHRTDLGHAASIRWSRSKAPALSRGSFKFPHFGDWTQEGQPCSQGQPSSSLAVSATQPSKTSKPRSAIPTPPAWPSYTNTVGRAVWK